MKPGANGHSPDPAAGVTLQLRPGKATDMRVLDVSTSYADFTFRAPMKFGGMILEKVTLLNVECEVVLRSGRTARGFGSMPLSNTWAFRSLVMNYDQTLDAMRDLAERCRRICAGHGRFGHPLELGIELEEEYLAAARDLSRESQLPEPIPKLASLVTGSPFDAALHDAFGKAHDLNCYQTYSREFLNHDLGAHLGRAHANEWPDEYLRRQPRPQIALYHAVGALDPLIAAEIARPVADGLPETLSEWIRWNGLTHLKIKLNGEDLNWDLDRVVTVHAVAEETRRAPTANESRYSLDFNERCPHVDYLVELLRKLRERTPVAFERLELIEQPMERDLEAGRQHRMHEAAKLAPVVIDESLTGLDSLLLARELGYTGIALKACKGQSQSLLMAAAARKLGMLVCVQDLGCPGASLVHSAGLAAHVVGVDALESNSRQYCPEANRGWEDRFPGLFRVRDGMMDTSGLTGVGLGAMPPASAGLESRN